MLRLVFLIGLASIVASTGIFSFESSEERSSEKFGELCKLFCSGNGTSIFFRADDNVMQPRIFCGLCKKIMKTTTITTTTSMRPTSTSTPTTTTTSTSTPTTTTTSTSTTTTTTNTTTSPSALTTAPTTGK